MVVFQCDGCGESVKKPKAEQHVHTCRACRALVCMDCMKRFTDDSYKQHTSCISEAEKYQGALYKPPKGKGPKQQQQKQQEQGKPKPQPQGMKRPAGAVEEKKPKEPTEPKEEPAAAAAKEEVEAEEAPAEPPVKKARRIRAPKDLVHLLVTTISEARVEGESREELQDRAERMLRRSLKKAMSKIDRNSAK